MDSRVALIKAFSGRFTPGTVKIETEKHGFVFLDECLRDGANLEYAELTSTRLLHKYKLTNVSESGMDVFLQSHVDKTCNVCRYFHPTANDVFCFNLDNNHKTNNTVILPEMDAVVRALREGLNAWGCEPMIVHSGRGYHVWCRTSESIENERLYAFMVGMAVRALMSFQNTSLDPHAIKFNFYPDVRIHDVVSLRMFGSEHAKNKVFSRILTPTGLLDENDSWTYFEDFLTSKIISASVFAAALQELQA